jgi:hypothetical protein
MKKLILFSLISFSALCETQYVDSYLRSDGTYVQGHYRDVPSQRSISQEYKAIERDHNIRAQEALEKAKSYEYQYKPIKNSGY